MKTYYIYIRVFLFNKQRIKNNSSNLKIYTYNNTTNTHAILHIHFIFLCAYCIRHTHEYSDLKTINNINNYCENNFLVTIKYHIFSK